MAAKAGTAAAYPRPGVQLNRLVKKIKKYNANADIDTVKRAYEKASASHLDQYRKSGEDFILHPLGVAEILADLRLDTVSITAAILHDVIEDTEVTQELIEEEFGAEVASIIDGLTKLAKIKFRSQEEQQAENLRKMLLAMTKDIRVILIKLADRLHNMRTICSLVWEKQREKAVETLEIYAPIAHRLGIFQLKWELEDLAFATLKPKRYEQIQRMVAERRREREAFIKSVAKGLSQELGKVGIEVDVSGRPKHFYSIHQKMERKGKEFSEIYDLSAIRVLVDSVKDCYASLGAIHALWTPVPGRFKDYIAMPKFNMYQALHTTVVGPKGRPLEIQVRTKDMHRTAEYGIAAHWYYKERLGRDKFEERLSWLRQILEWQSELKDPREFMEALKIDLYQDEVFVFTPKGDVISLPTGSGPIDFAYAIHTEVGNHCVGAKVNGRIAPLEYKLSTGDFVEVLTSKSAKPSRDWLSLAKSSRARSKIRQWFSKEMREDTEQEGREILIKLLRKQRLGQVALQGEHFAQVLGEFGFAKPEELFVSIGTGKTSPKQVATKLVNILTTEVEEEDEKELETDEMITKRKQWPTRTGVGVAGIDDVLIRLAHCCNPVPNDEIIGFVTRGRGVSVHRKDCPNAGQLLADEDRLVGVFWDSEHPAAFPVEIQVEAIDRTMLLRDVSTSISDSGVNILSASAATTRDHRAIFRFIFEIGNLAHLDSILATVKKIDTVYDAFRVVPRASRKGNTS